MTVVDGRAPRSWRRIPDREQKAPSETSTASNDPDQERKTSSDARQAQIETVLAAWRAWHGSFSAFCAHVRRDHRLEIGTTLIANILFEYGVRVPARRNGRSRDDEALRNSFEIFFPGTQWVGDGKQLSVVIDGKTFYRNLELVGNQGRHSLAPGHGQAGPAERSDAVPR